MTSKGVMFSLFTLIYNIDLKVSKKYALKNVDNKKDDSPEIYLLENVVVGKVLMPATPCPGQNSGDLANLLEVDGFHELPEAVSNFKKGEVFDVFRMVSI